jgi:O-antigen/teichoic acid export membrane protein
MLVLAGDQWGDAAPVLRWMALAALALSVKHVTKWTFMAEGRTRTQLVWSAVEAVITASCVGVGATFGVTQVAMAYALATVALTPITFAIWLRESPIRWPDVGAALSRPAIAVLAMTVAWLFLPVQDAAAWKQLGFAVAVLAPVYIGTWILLPGRRSALRELTDIRHAFNR